MKFNKKKNIQNPNSITFHKKKKKFLHKMFEKKFIRK